MGYHEVGNKPTIISEEVSVELIEELNLDPQERNDGMENPDMHDPRRSQPLLATKFGMVELGLLAQHRRPTERPFTAWIEGLYKGYGHVEHATLGLTIVFGAFRRMDNEFPQRMGKIGLYDINDALPEPKLLPRLALPTQLAESKFRIPEEQKYLNDVIFLASVSDDDEPAPGVICAGWGAYAAVSKLWSKLYPSDDSSNGSGLGNFDIKDILQR